ncbi:MAG: YraN family protein [Bacteroidales bacterium]|nr:YraN family protein [Bacteroidales bacterium]
MTDKQVTGQNGESLAQQHLSANGYMILDTNWRYGHLEVDIIALKENTLAFVEVKTRSSDKINAPEASVNLQKQRNLFRAANYYVTKHGYGYEVRFDIISIVQSAQGSRLEHMPDAFSPKW